MFSEKGNWMESLLSYESVLQSENFSNISNERNASNREECASGIIKSLYGLGALGTLSFLTNQSVSYYCNTESKQLLNETVWRVGKNSLNSLQSWSLPTDSNALDINNHISNSSVCKNIQNSTADFINRNISLTIDYISKMDMTSAISRIDQSADSIFSNIVKNIFDETASNVVNNISQAQQLIELREVCTIIANDDNDYCNKVLLRWGSFHEGALRRSSTVKIDSQLALRSTLLQQLLITKKATPLQILNCMSKMYPDLKKKEFAFSTSPILYKFWNTLKESIKLLKTPRLGREATYHWSILEISSDLEETKLLWKKGLRDIAISNINRNVIRQLQITNPFVPDDPRRNLLAASLRLCGEWISTRRAATGTEIIVDYLKPASLLACSEDEKRKAYTTLGSFNARLYHNVKEKVSSEEWKQGGRVLSDRITEFEKCRTLQNDIAQAAKRNQVVPDYEQIDIKAFHRHIITLKKEIDLDINERKAVELSVETFLNEAMSDYAKVLELSDQDDLELVFSFINLWLSNSSDPNINSIIYDSINKIPSYKFIPLTYQILSRLGNDDKEGSTNNDDKSDFQTVLNKVVYKLCSEHPFHTLPQLFALTNERDIGVHYDGAEQFLSNTSNNRFEKAKNVVKQLKENSHLNTLVTSTEVLLMFYIELAQYSTEAFQKIGKTKDIKFKEMQVKSRRFNECVSLFTCMPAVLTIQHSVRKTANYNEVVKISSFLPNFSITDHGISRPKIIICVGSDGKYYKQLVKGGDDMRQDAVMEQVFETVNYTLSHNSETRKRKLNIRTYKIIPTTPQTGVLQWVENTQAFGGILTDKDKGSIHYSIFN